MRIRLYMTGRSQPTPPPNHDHLEWARIHFVYDIEPWIHRPAHELPPP
ncbi:hypothetical protein RSAG8_07083, partial [Rhizoctonia solani AG-8 WAC10335]